VGFVVEHVGADLKNERSGAGGSLQRAMQFLRLDLSIPGSGQR
jgi:hypothetical protein